MQIEAQGSEKWKELKIESALKTTRAEALAVRAKPSPHVCPTRAIKAVA